MKNGNLITTLPNLPKIDAKTIPMHYEHWTVQMPTGGREYYLDEETARSIALQYGIGLVAPLYR